MGYLDKLCAVLQVLDYGDVKAFISSGQWQRASSHTGSNSCVFRQCFAEMPSAFWVFWPVTVQAGR